MRPLLEVNTLPLQHLRAAIELHGQRAVERELDVHPKTVYRWLTGRCHIPGRQHQAIKMLLGDLPGTAGRWTGWGFRQGKLYSPDGDAFTAGDVLSLILLRQQLSAQRQEIERLSVRLAIAEEAERRHAGAANEDLRARA